MRRIAELKVEVEHLRASTSQVCIYFYSIIVDLEACVDRVSFLLQPSTSSAPPPDHAKEISCLQGTVNITVHVFAFISLIQF